MGWQIIRTGRLTDAQIYALFQDLSSKFSITGHSYNISGLSIPYDADTFQKNFKTSKSYLIGSIDLRENEGLFSVYFRRGIGGTLKGIDDGTRNANAYFDEIGIHTPQPNRDQKLPSPEQVIALGRIVQKHVQVVPEPAADEAAAQGIDILQAQFARLNDLLTDLTERAQTRRQQLEDEFAERIRRQSEMAAAADEASQMRLREMDETHSARMAELDARAKQLDDRGHIHARRELRAQITDAIARRLQGAMVPFRTSSLRYAVLGLSLIGAAFLGAVSWMSLIEFGTVISTAAKYASPLPGGSPDDAVAAGLVESGAAWVLLARGAITGFGSIGFLVYAIAWLKNVYYDDVRTQRDLERYSIDLNRASWAVETIMESKAEGDGAIPDLVIAGVTRNLFDGVGGHRSGETSSDALASLLRASARAKIGPTGAEFELTGRGTNRLADKLDE